MLKFNTQSVHTGEPFQRMKYIVWYSYLLLYVNLTEFSFSRLSRGFQHISRSLSFCVCIVNNNWNTFPQLRRLEHHTLFTNSSRSKTCFSSSLLSHQLPPISFEAQKIRRYFKFRIIHHINSKNHRHRIQTSENNDTMPKHANERERRRAAKACKRKWKHFNTVGKNILNDTIRTTS